MGGWGRGRRGDCPRGRREGGCGYGVGDDSQIRGMRRLRTSERGECDGREGVDGVRVGAAGESVRGDVMGGGAPLVDDVVDARQHIHPTCLRTVEARLGVEAGERVVVSVHDDAIRSALEVMSPCFKRFDDRDALL